MFGFIRPVKAELRVKEADRFQQVYCGLCHAIRAEYGRFYTLFLSYDMTFFALVAGSEEAETAPPCRKRCDASPFRRKSCAETDDALRLAADASILLTYHKFQDDLADEKGAKRALAALLCRLGRRGYEKARARMPEADEDIRQALEDLRRLEAERCPSMDRAADTSSRMTAAVVPRTGDTRERILHQMFYQIGRWIYLVDAPADQVDLPCRCGAGHPKGYGREQLQSGRSAVRAANAGHLCGQGTARAHARTLTGGYLHGV